MEVIFVSADGSPDELMNYFKTSHGDWLAVQHGAILAEKLRSRLNACGGIPTLVVVSATDGKVISTNGRYMHFAHYRRKSLWPQLEVLA